MKAKLVFAVFCIALLSIVLAEEETKKEVAPEIVYIHYSTPEEAELAQKQILAQYEALGGSATIVTGEEAAQALAKEEARQASSAPAASTPTTTTTPTTATTPTTTTTTEGNVSESESS